MRAYSAHRFDRRTSEDHARPARHRTRVFAPFRVQWRSLLTIVRPDTFVRCHREGFRLFWRWKPRRQGRPLVRSIKEECLSRVVLLGERHLRRSVAEFVAHYHAERNHPYIRGARHYFRRVRRRTLYRLDGFVNQRLARWWARKHGARRPAWSLVSQDALRCHHGLERWNLPAALRPADSRFAR
jgi:Group II intron, maturase-specific domain